MSEFLAMLAHELRNPLAPIRNAVSIMSAVGDLAPQVAWSRDVIERQSQQLARLVDDLLDVSRITRGKLRLQAEPMDLRSAVTRAVESTRPLIDARRHRLHISMPPTPVTVHGDLTRLTQVVLNLLSNSAKYTPAGGDIWVDVDTDGRNAHVCVRDNGVGISPHVLANVFDLFAQGERTLDRSEGGLGIGLTLARRIIGLHGGSITANSAGPGQGAEFLATLPLLDLASGSAMPQPVTKPLARTARPRSILVVEDNEDAAASIAMLLGMVGHQVEIEANGAAVMGRVAAGGFEIVLLDIGLPGMSGYDVARALRASPEGHALRIYAMTGYGQEEDRKRSLASGFDGHLVKPVMPSDLITLIEQTSA